MCEAVNGDGIELLPESLRRWFFFDCLYTRRDVVSSVFGLLSMLCWIGAQFPQLVKNYRCNKSARALSPVFLALWLTGDAANLAGCVLTRQLPFQTYLAAYFVFIDSMLAMQYVYYVHLKHRIVGMHAAEMHDEDEHVSLLRDDKQSETRDSDDDASDHSAVLNLPSALPSSSLTLTLCLLCRVMVAAAVASMEEDMLPIDETNDATIDKTQLIIGQICAFISVICYLSSRTPQIIKNYKRQSVAGLAIGLFVLAVCGNATYVASVLIRHWGNRQELIDSIPYLLGSGGTLIFDFIIFLQWIYYEK